MNLVTMNPPEEIIWDFLFKDGANTGPLRVRVRGRSMAPTLRPGDVVLVEPAGPDNLRPGDVVLLRSGNGAMLHRFLGYTPQGWLLTQGDACACPDPPWPPEALLGKAVNMERSGRVQAIPCHPLRLKLRRSLHRVVLLLKLCLRLLFAFAVAKAFAVLPLDAAVTLVSFTASPQGQAIVVNWETASEVNMLGFYLWRSTEEGGSYSRISDLIPAQGDIVGATYRFVDNAVEPGQTYFYKLEAVETTGASQFYGPISATLPLPTPTPSLTPTPTFTPTPSFTPTPTPTFTPVPGFTPSPTPSFTPTPAPTFTPTPRPTPLPPLSPTPTFTRTSTPTPAPSPEPSPTSAPTLAPSPSLVFTSPLLPTPSPAFLPTPSPTIPPNFTTTSTRPVPRTPEIPGAASPSPWKLWVFLLVGGFLGCAMIFLGALSLRGNRKRG